MTARAAAARTSGVASAVSSPDLPVSDAEVLPAVRWNLRTFFVVPEAGGSEIVQDPEDGQGDGPVYTGPSGVPVAAAAEGSTLYVLTNDGGTVRLWSAAG